MFPFFITINNINIILKYQFPFLFAQIKNQMFAEGVSK